MTIQERRKAVLKQLRTLGDDLLSSDLDAHMIVGRAFHDMRRLIESGKGTGDGPRG